MDSEDNLQNPLSGNAPENREAAPENIEIQKETSSKIVIVSMEVEGTSSSLSSKMENGSFQSEKNEPKDDGFLSPLSLPPTVTAKKPDQETNQVTNPSLGPSSEMENGSLQSEKSESKDDGFLSPLSLPPTAKKPEPKLPMVSMSFRSKFAIPADIYKAPKEAAFMSEMFSLTKKESSRKEAAEASTSEEKSGKSNAPPAKLTYDPPEWRSVPEEKKYSFEVLKMGAIVDTVELSEKEFFLVGRLANCDIKLEHPSISRYHAVLQYGAPGPDAANVELQKDGSNGFYLYDLGSTHGTVINKHNIRPKTFYRIKVGHVIKFGGSTRMFVLQGPSDDQEHESGETATELREYNRQKIKKKKDLEKMMLGEDSSSDEEDGKKRKKILQDTESVGVTWGMLEDAEESSSEEEEVEEEGDAREDHPDAITVQIKKDPFYVKDPMKSLKNFYEREGIELEFECDERRSGHWHVRLCLPIDGASGKPVYCELNSTGKKKDAMRQCALESCRILEKHGSFRHKARQKQKRKQWEEDGYYDGDEDEFHDRTGELERKRNMRMQRAGKKSKTFNAVETYESLAKKVTDLDDEIKNIEMKLQKDREGTKVNPDAIDPLDAFMQQVKSGKALDTTTRAKLKLRILEARKEHMRASKLAELARPSSLPPLISSSSKNYSFIGKMKGKKKLVTNVRTSVNAVQETISEEIEEEEDGAIKTPLPKQTKIVKLMDIPVVQGRMLNSEENRTSSTNVGETTKNSQSDQNEISRVKKTDSTGKIFDVERKEVESCTKSDAPAQNRVLGPTLPQELKELLQAEGETLNQVDEDLEPKRKKRRPRNRKPRESINSNTAAQYSDDPKYSVWLPPEDQSGDGKTSLNEKLGY